MKVSINIDMPERPSSPARPSISLLDRVEYAIAQIDCKTPSKRAAIDFLRGVVHKVEALKRPSEEQTHCKKLAEAAVRDFGTYYADNKKEVGE